MKRLLYISTLPKESQTGGANAVNFHTYRQLERHFNCTYVQINPKESFWEKYKSKFIRKILDKPGAFDFFSVKRLNNIRDEYLAIPNIDAFDIVFFRGFTPWMHIIPKQPFVAYNDVHFKQFFENTFNYKNFKTQDLNRIFNSEKRWLSNAKTLFFESEWGASQCYLDYKIDASNLINIGRGGNIPIPDKDRYDGSYNLVIIANDFYQKGGDLVFEAFQNLKQKNKTLQLHIIGGDPGHSIRSEKGVYYHGVLRKEDDLDLSKLISIVSKAFLLMHVTREDTNPLVITEAGYFGCPTISVNHYAIPELVINDKTGLLLSYLPKPQAISNTIENLILQKHLYLEMRKQTWIFNHAKFSWSAIGKNITNKIKQH